MTEPCWLTVDDLVAINRAVTAVENEPFNLIDPDLLAGAQARPINRFHYGGEADIVAHAALLCVAVCQNHPFEQGNKRTGFVGMREMLRINGYRLNVTSDGGELAEALIQVVEHKLAAEQFDALVDACVTELDEGSAKTPDDQRGGRA